MSHFPNCICFDCEDREMTDDAKPQAVPKCGELIAHEAHPFRYIRDGEGNIVDEDLCPGLQPTQAVGDEVDAAQAISAVPPCLACGREIKDFGTDKGWDHADPAGTSHLTLADRVRVDAMHIMSMIDHQSYSSARRIAGEMAAYMKRVPNNKDAAL